MTIIVDDKISVNITINKISRQFSIFIKYLFIIYPMNELYVEQITISMSKVFIFMKILALIKKLKKD